MRRQFAVLGPIEAADEHRIVHEQNGQEAGEEASPEFAVPTADRQKATVRVLLCGPAGQLALKAYEPPALKPRYVTPKQMMTGLIKGGATVEVCALFLPNADKTPADLIDGVTVAKPPEVAAYMMKPGVRAFGF